ncbi:MAG: hypothetical protein ACLFWL_16490 [Candidatus Brocadiia bacterium]
MRKEWIIALILLIAGIAAPARATNETIHVQARQKDNPQEEAEDIEGHFSSEPTGENDEIHVTNSGVKGKAAGVYDDPVNDGALLVITRREDPVKVEVEGREGIGALYWVSVVPGGGEGGGGGAAPTVLWADVKDMEEPGSLVLRDDNTGRGVSDSDNISEDEDGDPGTDLPSLHCSLAEDDRGDVSFRLNVQSGTYDWSATSGHSGTWTGPPYLTSLSDLNPGVYTVTVTKDGEPDFERKIRFSVISVTIKTISRTTIEYCQETELVANVQPAGRTLKWAIEDLTEGVDITPDAGDPVSQGLRQSIGAARFTKSGSFKARVYDAEFPSASAQTTIDVKGFVRTDCQKTDPTKATYGVWMGIAHGNAHSDQKTFVLKYGAARSDECEGRWKHNYFLESQNKSKMTLKNDSPPLIAGGVAVAVAWTVEIDGKKEWEVTFGGDCRGGSGPGGSIAIPVGDATVTIPLSFNKTEVTVGQSFAKLFTVPVQRPSPEGQNLSRPVEVLIRGNGVIRAPRPLFYEINPHNTTTETPIIKWKNSEVLSTHFEPLRCSER